MRIKITLLKKKSLNKNIKSYNNKLKSFFKQERLNKSFKGVNSAGIPDIRW